MGLQQAIRRVRRRCRGFAVGIAATGWATLIGCVPSPAVLVDAEGNPITRAQIAEITDDDTLSDNEKREQLRELGITNEALIELLLQG